ncbi:MAG: TVP38/TMEM64 family protein, partial [Clostridia bacterium]|nr:TVP38/TMEM64 family protein [Clostridia bacterium]
MKRRHWPAVLALAVVLLGGGAYLLWRTGFFTAVTSMEGTQQYIEHFSPYSQLVFFLVQLASVILAPIPSNITAAAGGLLFGMWPSFLLTWAAVTLGSMTVFWLSRVIGQPFVNRFVSQKVSERYLDLIKRKRDVFLTLVFLFPFFPDDLICIMAGLTDIGCLRFFIIVTLTRPWGLLVASG